MAFQKGQSGNPKGRPRGTSKADKLRKAIEKDVPGIIEALVKAAQDGDTSAARLLLDRVIPALKPVDSKVTLPMGGSLSEAGAAILEAVGAGEITPDQAGKLLQGLGAQARVLELDQLRERLEALERTLQARGKPE
jgi:hypothetical protein